MVKRLRAGGSSMVELLDNVGTGVVQLDRPARALAANDDARVRFTRAAGCRTATPSCAPRCPRRTRRSRGWLQIPGGFDRDSYGIGLRFLSI